jgi:hypothetical protein
MDRKPMASLMLLVGLITAAGLGLAQEEESAPTDLEVVTMAFGTDYDYAARALVGEAEVFPADVAVVWCQTRIDGATDPTTVTHVWHRDGKTMARVGLPVSSPSFRTVSSKKILPAWTGRWEVTVLDAEGTILRSETFTVE